VLWSTASYGPAALSYEHNFGFILFVIIFGSSSGLATAIFFGFTKDNFRYRSSSVPVPTAASTTPALTTGSERAAHDLLSMWKQFLTTGDMNDSSSQSSGSKGKNLRDRRRANHNSSSTGKNSGSTIALTPINHSEGNQHAEAENHTEETPHQDAPEPQDGNRPELQDGNQREEGF
jgi:hypothetical protein